MFAVIRPFLILAYVLGSAAPLVRAAAPTTAPAPVRVVTADAVKPPAPGQKGETGDRFPRTVRIVPFVDLTPAQRHRVTATRVTLRFKDATPQAVIAELARQSGVAIAPNDPEFWANHRSPVTVDLDAVPLWVAVSELTRSGLELRIRSPDRFQLQAPTPPPPQPHYQRIVSGPFLLEHYSVTAPGPSGNKRESRAARFEIHLWNTPEPKVWVMAGARSPTLTEAVDERGKPFEIPPPGRPWIMEGAGVSLVFNRGPDGGDRVARIGGLAHVFAVLEADRAEVADLLASRGQELTVGGLRMRVDPVQEEAARGRGFDTWYTLRVTVWRDGRDGSEWHRVQQLLSGSRLRVQNAAGEDLHHEGELPPRSDDAIVRIMKVPTGSPRDTWGSGPPGRPARFLIEVPTVVSEVDIPFLFQDLPLPLPE